LFIRLLFIRLLFIIVSGHSKWSKVKHQKATTDAVKSKAFTKAGHAITVAVREGGGMTDPARNFHLRLAIEKAREVNMPRDNIKRAIERGKGIGSVAIEQILYEGYGPFGVAFLIDAMTDNRQRSVAAIKNLLDRSGGTIARPGAVSYLFERLGVITVPKITVSYDTVFEAAVELGARDVVETADMVEVYTDVEKLGAAKEALHEKGIPIDNADIIMIPKTSIGIDTSQMQKIDSLAQELESLDDVQHVYTNAEERSV
jgi:YebC/PmpR family DNA-binding regulatory protein